MPPLRNYYLKVVDEWLLELSRISSAIVQQLKTSEISAFLWRNLRDWSKPRGQPERSFLHKKSWKGNEIGKSSDFHFSITEKIFLIVVYSRNLFSIQLKRANIFGRHILTERSLVSKNSMLRPPWISFSYLLCRSSLGISAGEPFEAERSGPHRGVQCDKLLKSFQLQASD